LQHQIPYTEIMDYSYAYLIGTLIFGFVWLTLFFVRKDTRKEMLLVSLFIGILAPLWAPWFFRDYWNPLYAWFFGIEDFLYGFFAGGIVSVIYEIIFGRRLSKRRTLAYLWTYIFGILLFIAAIVFGVLWHIYTNAIYSAFSAYAVFTLGLLWFRRDLILNAFISGFLFVAVTFVFYTLFTFLFPGIIQAWWQLEYLSGLYILGIPIEELVWAFGMGFAGGPLYEFIVGRRTVMKD
jgi:hypothetical protein